MKTRLGTYAEREGLDRSVLHTSMVLSDADCDDCRPSYLHGSVQAPTAIIFSSLPFLLTFLFVATVVFQKLYPMVSGNILFKDASSDSKVLQGPFSPRLSSSSKSPPVSSISPLQRISAFAFSTTIALAAVLAELVLCEISDTINPVARSIALRITISVLLILLIVIIPSLEIHSVILAAGWRYTGNESGRLKLAWILQAGAFTAWILGFWWSGQLLLANHRNKGPRAESHVHPVDAIVEHVGVIGISLMALLSGFASVSSPWQHFGARRKIVSEAAIARKQAGLDATNDMLATKRSRLRAIERKLSDAPSEGFFQKAIGSFRGNADLIEKKNLELEIAGLENMALSLSTHRSVLQSHANQQQRARTPVGRLLLFASYLFSGYCLYRILTTSIIIFRRRLSPHDTSPGSDPINNILAVLVKHYDSHLDRDAWTRQISFLLSGIMLFASFSSVLQTFHLFARFTPSLLKAAQANLPLIVAQVCATYVISAALLLRTVMPGQVVNDRLKGLGGSNMQWVDGWFDVWFMGGVVLTVAGIWVGKKLVGDTSDWEDDGDVEMGKRS